MMFLKDSGFQRVSLGDLKNSISLTPVLGCFLSAMIQVCSRWYHLPDNLTPNLYSSRYSYGSLT